MLWVFAIPVPTPVSKSQHTAIAGTQLVQKVPRLEPLDSDARTEKLESASSAPSLGQLLSICSWHGPASLGMCPRERKKRCQIWIPAARPSLPPSLSLSLSLSLPRERERERWIPQRLASWARPEDDSACTVPVAMGPSTRLSYSDGTLAWHGQTGGGSVIARRPGPGLGRDGSTPDSLPHHGPRRARLQAAPVLRASAVCAQRAG
jgi:hypothetical protein